MLKKLLVVTAFGVAGFVVAQSLTADGAKGRGVAMNENGRGGRFGMDVRKITNAKNESRIEGGFEFVSMSNNASDTFKIMMRRAEVFGSEGNVAEFAGPAKLMRRSATGPVVVEGRLFVAVKDNRAPGGGQGDPDWLRFRFVSPNAPNPIEFMGKVRDGDILVYHRP